jgi:hypothetical protein
VATVRSVADRSDVKADEKLLDSLFREIRACQAGKHGEHHKCEAIEVLRPRFFLGVAAGESWRLFSVGVRDGRAVLADELSDLRELSFKR